MLHTSWCKSSSVQRMWEHWLAAGNIHSHSSKLMYFEGKRLYPWYLITRLIRLTAQRGQGVPPPTGGRKLCCICMRVRKQPHVHVPLEGFEGRISQAASKPLDSLNRLYSSICRSLSKSSQISIFFVFCFFSSPWNLKFCPKQQSAEFVLFAQFGNSLMKDFWIS